MAATKSFIAEQLSAISSRREADGLAVFDAAGKESLSFPGMRDAWANAYRARRPSERLSKSQIDSRFFVLWRRLGGNCMLAIDLTKATQQNAACRAA